MCRSYHKQVGSYIGRLFNTGLCLLLLICTACQVIPANPTTAPPNKSSGQSAHERRLGTPLYGGGGAIIFVMDQITNNSLKSAADAIIRSFGDNNVPLTVAVAPASENSSSVDTSFLTGYVDAGMIDICIDGYSLSWLPSGLPLKTVSKWPEYSALTESIKKNSEQIKLLFGDAPSSCIIPSSAFDESNYTALQNAGLSVLCSTTISQAASVQPVAWSGKEDLKGLYRLPVVGTVFATEPEANSSLLTAAARDLDDLGATVIEIKPASFLGSDQQSNCPILSSLAANSAK